MSGDAIPEINTEKQTVIQQVPAKPVLDYTIRSIFRQIPDRKIIAQNIPSDYVSKRYRPSILNGMVWHGVYDWRVISVTDSKEVGVWGTVVSRGDLPCGGLFLVGALGDLLFLITL